MALLGSVKAVNFLLDAADADFPAVSAPPLEITAQLASDVSSLEIFNYSEGILELLEGPDSNLKLICYIPGSTGTVGILERQPIALPANLRLSIRSAGDAAISAGLVVINGWV